MKIVSIFDTRPQFIHNTVLHSLLRERHQLVTVRTGQHYDHEMSRVFFDELGNPRPDYNLEIGSDTAHYQVGKALIELGRVLYQERPDCVLVRGDTNATLAGALAAALSGIPLAHVEAGERSFNKSMPEEINRLVTDRLADLHFCVSHNSIRNLAKEGMDGMYLVGDTLLDVAERSLPAARESNVLNRLGLQIGDYALVTVHRKGNTENEARLRGIVEGLGMLDLPIVFPAHPRTQQALERYGLEIDVIEPVGYLDMLKLEENALAILTDSGGVQREAYFLGVPCLTLREETEWIETVEAGWNQVVGSDPRRIVKAWMSCKPPLERPSLFGNGRASERIVGILEKEFENGHLGLRA